ncbi:MAG: DUF3301 domain-containing protein [Magnetococcales bacterium]|nr:DUF3301 domain-containing protein [Magnetococcales bacterium]
MDTNIPLAIIILIGIYWYFSMKARERALRVAKGTCQEMEAELLDDTVAITHLRLKRDPGGQLRVRRIYEFNYILNHPTPRTGTIILLGEQVEAVLVDTKSAIH